MARLCFGENRRSNVVPLGVGKVGIGIRRLYWSKPLGVGGLACVFSGCAVCFIPRLETLRDG